MESIGAREPVTLYETDRFGFLSLHPFSHGLQVKINYCEYLVRDTTREIRVTTYIKSVVETLLLS